MAIIKVIELLAQSDKSWEDATKVAVEEAARTVRNIKSVYIKDFQALVQDGEFLRGDQVDQGVNKAAEAKIQYRVNAKVSFEVDEEMREQLHEKSAREEYKDSGSGARAAKISEGPNYTPGSLETGGPGVD